MGLLLLPLGCESPVEVKTETVHVIGTGPWTMEDVALGVELEGRGFVPIGSWPTRQSHFEFTVEVQARFCSDLRVRGWWSGLFAQGGTQAYNLGRCGDHHIVLIEDEESGF